VSEPYLIVGLGNPGSEYERTRHNVGFWALDLLQAQLRFSDFKEKFGGAWTKGTFRQGATTSELLLLKPLTYMNKSGEPTQALASFFKVPVSNIIVIHDELDFEPGVVRLKQGGGAGGHNGLRSLISCVGADFVRVRLGVGKPRSAQHGADHVLSAPPKAELLALEEAAQRSADAALLTIERGIKLAMNSVNTATGPSPS
jgi:peptidyl-tRNA hydrolase, PTH1 family